MGEVLAKLHQIFRCRISEPVDGLQLIANYDQTADCFAILNELDDNVDLVLITVLKLINHYMLIGQCGENAKRLQLKQ